MSTQILKTSYYSGYSTYRNSKYYIDPEIKHGPVKIIKRGHVVNHLTKENPSRVHSAQRKTPTGIKKLHLSEEQMLAMKKLIIF